MSDTRVNFFERCQHELERQWTEIGSGDSGDVSAKLPAAIRSAIIESVNAKTMSFRYVLPTQLLGKLIDPALHACSSQAGSGLDKAWDARSLCHKVVVPFDRRHHNVLGGSGQPYLSKPLREQSISKDFIASKRNRDEYQNLIDVLCYAQLHPEEIEAMLRVALSAIRDRLDEVAIVYPVPNRPSYEECRRVFREFLRERTGGIRLQAVVVALFRTIGQEFSLFEQVEAGNINAADMQTGNVADLECIGHDNSIVFAVEVKDRKLALVDVQGKVPSIREKGVADTIFLVKEGIDSSEQAQLQDILTQQFSSGHNLYLAEYEPFQDAMLMLIREGGRRRLLKEVADELDRKAGLEHRQRWCMLLDKM